MKATIDYNPANVVTMGKALLGLYSTFLVFSGQTLLSMKLVLLALILDSVDGKIARFFRYESDFGAVLDSLSDTVSFGIAPAVLMFNLLDAELYVRYLLSSTLLSAQILQVARSTEKLTLQKFVGLPVHIGALATVGILLATFYPVIVSVVLFLIISALLVSNVVYYSLKSGKEQYFLAIPGILIVGILLFDDYRQGLGFLLSLVTIVYIIVAPFYEKTRKSSTNIIER